MAHIQRCRGSGGVSRHECKVTAVTPGTPVNSGNASPYGAVGEDVFVEAGGVLVRGSNQFADVTGGVVYIHSSPAALCPHIEWTLSSTLKAPAKLRWTSQPASPGQLRATTDWVGPVGTGGKLADALRAWPVLRFEVTEDP